MIRVSVDTRSALGDVSRWRRFLVAYQASTRQEVARLIATTCMEIEATAKQLAPVDTGRLRSSIRTVLTRVATDLEGAVETDVSYAAIIEFGSRKSAAQPYLVPALEAALPGFIADLRRIYRAA